MFKKTYCGILGGLTFYRICLICKSKKKNLENEEKNEKQTKKCNLSCTWHVQNPVVYNEDPFCGLLYVLFPSGNILILFITATGGLFSQLFPSELFLSFSF